LIQPVFIDIAAIIIDDGMCLKICQALLVPVEGLGTKFRYFNGSMCLSYGKKSNGEGGQIGDFLSIFF
jgi:hypothetical protein